MALRALQGLRGTVSGAASPPHCRGRGRHFNAPEIIGFREKAAPGRREARGRRNGDGWLTVWLTVLTSKKARLLR